MRFAGIFLVAILSQDCSATTIGKFFQKTLVESSSWTDGTPTTVDRIKYNIHKMPLNENEKIENKKFKVLYFLNGLIE